MTHDRYFLENAAQWILELDRGHAYPYQGNYSTYLDTKASRLKVEGAKDAKRRKRLEDELEWVRSNPKARQAKSRARLQRYEEMATEAESRRKLDFEEIQIPPGPRLGGVVVETEGLVKGFGDRVLFDGLSFSLPRNGLVGVIGPNGVGKTTLFKMIVGEEQPDAGTIRVGETVEISYVDQSRERIAPDKNVWEVISDGETHINAGRTEIPSRAYVAAFGFKGPDQQKPAGVLSGGERNRVNLALTLKKGGNLLLLDEPTNDLDLDTLRVVEDFLEDWPGALALVSHDRTFLERTTERLVAVETGGTLSEVAGGVAGWVARPENASGARAGSPRSRALTKPAGRKPEHRSRSRAAGSEAAVIGAAVIGRRVRDAEKEMLRLERRRDQVRQALTATVDYVELTRLGDELHAVQAALDAAEESWLALALEAEG